MSQALIRSLLRSNAGGLTVTSIANRLKKPRENAAKQIQTMPDVYISRWIDGPLRSPVPYVPVYAVAQVPANAPRPEGAGI